MGAEIAALVASAACACGISCVWSPSPLGPVHAAKPHGSFPAFYPLYLQQHRKPLTKMTHVVGTGIFLSICYVEPRLLFGISAAVAVGSFLCPLFRHHAHGAVEGALALGAYFAVGRWATGGWRAVALAPLCAYFWAWVGHFFVEHNRPATFIYPSYSLLGDFRMFFELLTLQRAWDGNVA